MSAVSSEMRWSARPCAVMVSKKTAYDADVVLMMIKVVSERGSNIVAHSLAEQGGERAHRECVKLQEAHDFVSAERSPAHDTNSLEHVRAE
jgi:hypothetical protein